MNHADRFNRQTRWGAVAMFALGALLLLPGAGMSPRGGGSSASAQQTPATEPSAKQSAPNAGSMRHFLTLVVGADRITLQGKDIALDQLRDALNNVPDKANTVLEMAYDSDQLTIGQYNKVKLTAVNLVKQVGLEYISEVGKKPLGAKGGPDEDINAARSKAAGWTPRSEAASSKIRGIMLALFEYSADHGGVLPPDLGATLQYAKDPEIYLSADDLKLNRIPANLSPEWINQHASYVYLGSAHVKISWLSPKAHATSLVHEKLDQGEDNKVVLSFLDGHTERLPVELATTIIEATKVQIQAKSKNGPL